MWSLALPDGWRSAVERCVIWQQRDGWKIRGVVCARCVGSRNRGMMGCGVIHTAVRRAISPASLRFSECSLQPQRGLRNDQHLQASIASSKQGNVSNPYTTQFTLAAGRDFYARSRRWLLEMKQMMDEGRKLPAGYRNTRIIKASTSCCLWLVPIKDFGNPWKSDHLFALPQPRFEAINLMSISCLKGFRILMLLLED